MTPIQGVQALADTLLHRKRIWNYQLETWVKGRFAAAVTPLPSRPLFVSPAGMLKVCLADVACRVRIGAGFEQNVACVF